MAAAKTQPTDPLERIKSLLSELGDAVDALDSEETGEGENEPEASPATAAPPNEDVSLPWRKRAKAKPAAK